MLLQDTVDLLNKWSEDNTAVHTAKMTKYNSGTDINRPINYKPTPLSGVIKDIIREENAEMHKSRFSNSPSMNLQIWRQKIISPFKVKDQINKPIEYKSEWFDDDGNKFKRCIKRFINKWK
jgi:hypothetical protein